MPRPAGARNHDFDEKRAALLDTLTDFALAAALTRPSLRQFAIAAHQSEPTLRHYFVDRQGLVIEIIGNLNKRAQVTWEMAARPAANPADAVNDYLTFSQAGMEKGVFNRFHAFALIEAFADDTVGKVYLDQILEPSLKAFSDKLRNTPGATRDEAELRAATLLASAPLLVLGMHQELLGGKNVAPIDMNKTFALMKKWLSQAFTAA
jgi:AcrR family transcriptional regulator